MNVFWDDGDGGDRLTIALPKGRILEDVVALFEKANVIPEKEFFDDNSRKLIFATNDENVRIVRARSFDIATLVTFGGVDVGICGYDVLMEFESSEIYDVADLEIAKCRLAIAKVKEREIDFDAKSHIKVATKYPEVTRKYFNSLGMQPECIKLSGAIEIAPKLGLCDVIVDLVSTGNTLKENGLNEVSTIAEISSHLIVNKTAFKTKNEAINSFLQKFCK